MKNIVALGIVAFLLMRCDSGMEEAQKLRVQTGEPETISLNDTGEVHLSFSEEKATLTEGETTAVILENNTNETLSMGRHYYVEVYEEDDTWTEINIPISFTEDIVLVEPGDEFLFELILLPEGKEGDTLAYESDQYRFRKEFGLGEEGSINTYEISVSFDLIVE